MVAAPTRGEGERVLSRRGVRHAAVLAAALGLSTFVAWRILATTIGHRQPETVAALLTGSGAEGRATALAPSQPSASASGAASAARARALLAAEPLSSDAYVVLALAADRSGYDDEAARLMRIAAAWWPRDILAQTWLLGRDLRLGDSKGAIARFDAIARGRPETLDALTEAVAPVLADGPGSAAFVECLASDPPWRTRFIDVAVRQWREPGGLTHLLEGLQATSSGLKEAELRPYLAKLLQVGRLDQAYLTWLRSLPRDRLSDLTYLYNGGFRYPVTGLPFDWAFPTVSSASIGLSTEGTRRILTAGFLGGRVSLPPVSHGLVLAPGAYRLTGRVRTDRLRVERGVRWQLVCHGAPEALAVSEPFLGSSAWHDFAMAFDIPDTGCEGQTLSLEIDARSEFERRASGIVAFTGLDIEAR